MFTISNHAWKKISQKRKRKGLTEPEPRKYNMYTQFLLNSISFGVGCTLVAPIERVRILKQTKHITRPEYAALISDSSIANMRQIIKDQGAKQLWRGNSVLLYKQMSAMSVKIIFYDKFKQYFMPYEQNKYNNLQFAMRSSFSSICCLSMTLFFSYPLDLIHTRMTADMSKVGRNRVYKSTFDAFNRTHIDEGKYSLFKGSSFAVAGAIGKISLNLPLYELILRNCGTSDSYTDRFMQRIGAAMLSGTLISALVYPFDTLKRISQMNGGRSASKLYKTDLELLLKAQ